MVNAYLDKIGALITDTAVASTGAINAAATPRGVADKRKWSYGPARKIWETVTSLGARDLK
jgi:hypothetical protein